MQQHSISRIHPSSFVPGPSSRYFRDPVVLTPGVIGPAVIVSLDDDNDDDEIK